jgi:hypothetical protein
VLTNKYFYANLDENVTSTEELSPDCNTIEKHSAYDSENHPYASWLWVDSTSSGHSTANQVPTEQSTDRLTKSFAVYTNISGAWFRATNSYTYLTDGGTTATKISEVRQRLNGFASGVKAEMTVIDVNSNTVTQTVYVDRAARKVTTVVTSASSTLPATNIVLNGLSQSDSTFTVAKPALYT